LNAKPGVCPKCKKPFRDLGPSIDSGATRWYCFEDNILFEDGKRVGDIKAPEFDIRAWNEVAGLVQVKAALYEAIIMPLKHAELFEKYRVAPPVKGILMFGPPGCGKTMIASAIAKSVGVGFVQRSGTDIHTKYYGESAVHARDMFEEARNSAPCVLFIDEIDAVVPARSESDDVSAREDVKVVSEILSQMDGLTSLKGVVVIGATNRPQVLDPAIVRPGRFDKILYVPPPDKEARKTLLERNLEGVPTSGIDLDQIVTRTEGYSGADLVAVSRQAKLAAIREALIRGEETHPVTMEHLVRGVREVKSSIRSDMTDQYRKFAEAYQDMVLAASIVPCLTCGNSLPIEVQSCGKCGTKNPYFKPLG
jgi:transitional endoplasmic reticulum ATPase